MARKTPDLAHFHGWFMVRPWIELYTDRRKWPSIICYCCPVIDKQDNCGRQFYVGRAVKRRDDIVKFLKHHKRCGMTRNAFGRFDT